MAKRKQPTAPVEEQIEVEVTAETLELNPELSEAGIKIGEILQVAANDPEAAEAVKAEAHAYAQQSNEDVKYLVHFGVNIPDMNKVYSKEELEADTEACAYLVEIGSPSVTIL